MAVMRSVFYIPGNSEKFIAKAPTTPADIITLDLEDSVPPAEKARARQMVRENLKLAGSGGSTVYVRLNNWETLMTNEDIEAVVYEGLSGVCLAKCGGPDDVKRLDWKLEEVERRRGLKVGSIAVQLLIETAKGVMNAYPSALASKRVNSHLRRGGLHQGHAREADQRGRGATVRALAHGGGGLGKRAAWPLTALVDIKDTEAFEKSTRFGRQLGYEGAC